MKEQKNNIQQETSSPGFPFIGNWQQVDSGMPNLQYISNQFNGENVVPRVDVIDTDQNIVYVFEVPGADPDKIELDIDQNQLFINSPIETVNEHNNTTYLYKERFTGKFVRVLNMPINVDSEQVSADFKNGLLEVSFKKLKGKHSKTV